MERLEIANGLRHCRRIGAVIGLCIVQAACSTSQQAGISSPDDPQTRDLITQTIELVATRYIDPISREQILVNTLDGLAEIDDNIRVGITPDDLVLQYDDRTIQTISLPHGAYDASTPESAQIWSEITLRGLGSYRAYSPLLRTAPTPDVQSALVSGAIRNLDRYSRYEGPKQAETARNRRDGYIGIGVRLVGGTGYPVVKLVHPESPADTAGLHPGDQIVSVNGFDMYGKAGDVAAELLHGEEGTSVRIEVNSAGSVDITPMEIMRERVIDRTVFTEFRDNILIARITSFNSATATTLADSILKAQLYDGGLQGVVLDLRGNRGGLLQQGVAVADLFLPNGPIGNTFSRVTAARHIFTAETNDLSNGAPLVVLIDGRTASSARQYRGSHGRRGSASARPCRRRSAGSARSPVSRGSSPPWRRPPSALRPRPARSRPRRQPGTAAESRPDDRRGPLRRPRGRDAARRGARRSRRRSASPRRQSWIR